MTKTKTIEATLRGTLVFARKDLLSIEFAQSEDTGTEERLIRMTPKVKARGFKKLSDLSRGDLLEVKFDQVVLPAEKDGEAARTLDTTAVQISRVKTAKQLEAERPKTPALPELPEPADEESGNE